MDHLRTRIGLLIVVRNSDAIELRLRVVATQDARGILPGNGTSRLYLCPGELGIHTTKITALCHKVEHTTLAVLVARIPVLYGGVFHLCPILDDNLYDGCVQLVLITHRSRTAFQIGDIGIIVGDDQRTLKLSRVTGVDAEIAAQFHRTAHALRDINK